MVGCARSSVAIDPVKGDGPLRPPVDPARAVAARGDKTVPGDKFEFPADKGGKLLGETLRPGQKAADAPATPPAPRPLVAPPAVARPEVQLSLPPLGLPRPTLTPKAPPLRPHILPEEAPLSAYRSDPRAVRPIYLAHGALVVVPSADVNLPPWLPFLASLGIDRAPTDDPTGEDSQKIALSAAIPIRANPAPFLRLNLPDPFENGQVVRLRALPPEDPTPSAGPVKTLK